MKNKLIFITGGAGFLGRQLIAQLYADNEITVYSRDEAKHYYLKKEYPKIRTVIGDIRDRNRLVQASAGHDYGIFAASMKQIEACYDNYEEANKTIVEGAFNSRYAAEENDLTACYISSDKSRAATTIYGAMKYVAGEAFIANSSTESPVPLTTIVYGNVLNSTGSVIPLIWNAISNKYPLELYSEEMTRFVLPVTVAVDTVLTCLTNFYFGHCTVVPAVRSCRIQDLFKLYEQFGLKYTVGKPRPGEKLHEVMITAEEAPRTRWHAYEKLYAIHAAPVASAVTLPEAGYSSKDWCMSYEQLDDLLKQYGYFKP